MKRKGKCQYLLDYDNREQDLETLGIKEFPERLERYTRAKAGDTSRYTDAATQMDEDKQYLDSYNGKYNHFETTQKNLMTLGAWGEKRPYYQMQKGQIIRNGLRVVGNAGKLIRNYTFRPVYGTIGKYVVAPIHRKLQDKDEIGMYKSRPLHRYEARKEYFATKGNNFFMSRVKAITQRGQADKEIVQQRIEQIKSAEQETMSHADETIQYRNEIERLRSENQFLRSRDTRVKTKYSEWEGMKKQVQKNQKQIETYQQLLSSKLNSKDALGGEAISSMAHQRANKGKITGITTLANLGMGIGIKRLTGHLANQIQYAKTMAGSHVKLDAIDMEDVLQCVKEERIKGLTLEDFMTISSGKQKVPLQYAVNYGVEKDFPIDAIRIPRGITFETPKGGIVSMADGKGFDINGYANFLTDKPLSPEDNVWDTLANLFNKAGIRENETGENIWEWFKGLTAEERKEFISKIDITVGRTREGMPLGHLDGSLSNVNNIIEDTTR